MVVYRRTQAVFAMNRCIRNNSGALLLQPEHELRVKRLKSFAVDSIRTVSKANNVDTRRSNQLQERFGLNQCAQTMTLRDATSGKPTGSN